MTVHWSWGLAMALITITIWLNGRGIRAGWLLGAAVQIMNLTFGYFVYGQATFLLLAIPAGAFLYNWWAHPRRVKPAALPQCMSEEVTVKAE